MHGWWRARSTTARVRRTSSGYCRPSRRRWAAPGSWRALSRSWSRWASPVPADRSSVSGDAGRAATGEGAAMDPRVARNIAHYSHRHDRDRFGELVMDHVERVGDTVPDEARAVAFLHDVLEQTGTSAAELIAQGLTPLEMSALKLLTRSDLESYELYVLRVAWATGPEGELARCVKMADLDDHLSHVRIPAGAPPYAWARRHIRVAQERQHSSAAAA